MTELLTRPPAATTSTVSDSSGSGSVWWRGCLAAVWALALGLATLVMLVLVVWATDSRSGAGAGQAIRFALQLWLVAHKVPLHIGAGAVAVTVLFAGGMVLDLVSLAVHARTAASLSDALGTGVVAGFALLVADALLLPNAALATLGYLTGPGFAVGTGTSVSLGGSHVGSVPALPLLAALPHGPAPILVRLFAIVLLLLAGGLAAWWVVRDGETTPSAILTRVFGAAGCAGVLAAMGVAAAAGPAGPGRMAAVGASAWQVGLVLAGEIAFVATLVALPLSWRRG